MRRELTSVEHRLDPRRMSDETPLETAGPDVPPDRLAIDPRSPHFDGDKLGRGVVALASEQDGKAILLVAVTKDLTAKLKAGDLVKEAAKLVGGAGGGKPDLAQAGGSDPAGIEKALEKVQELAARALG